MEGETNNASQSLAIQGLEPIQLSLLGDKSLMSDKPFSGLKSPVVRACFASNSGKPQILLSHKAVRVRCWTCQRCHSS